MGQVFQPPERAPVAQVAPIATPVLDELEEFGSNQDRLAELSLQTAPAQTAPAQTAPAQAPEKPPTLDRAAVMRSLGRGKNGEDVAALQRFLGLKGDAADGDYGKGTAGKVREWQEKNGLDPTGSVGPRTIAAMRGDPYIYGYSMSHDPAKFVPKYPMTAYHESGIYRKTADPYAVGAITHPSKDQDAGGKTYGPYQFESYHYPDGTKDKNHAHDSTLQRFVNWKDNPYGAKLKEVIEKKGIASADFDKLWGELSGSENKSFGQAQEQFLEIDVADRVKALMDAAGASETARKDPRLMDLMMGTVNQYRGLAKGHIASAAAAQTQAKRTFSADELALAIQDNKAANVESNFKSSPDAWEGLRARIADERAVFAPKKK